MVAIIIRGATSSSVDLSCINMKPGECIEPNWKARFYLKATAISFDPSFQISLQNKFVMPIPKDGKSAYLY